LANKARRAGSRPASSEQLIARGKRWKRKKSSVGAALDPPGIEVAIGEIYGGGGYSPAST
jgi:hypothetical protein